MKQLLILALAIIGLSSCNKDDFAEESPVAAGKEMWEMVSKQNRLVLDPFNVAFRLNTYLVEKEKQETDPDADPEYLDKILDTLFGFSHRNDMLTQDGTKWKIDYPGNYIVTGPNGALLDSRRTGLITIETGGKKLSEEGASWTITPTSLTTYTKVYGRDNLVSDINWSSYSIVCSSANNWDVEVRDFTSWYYEYPPGNKMTADWTMTYYVSQNTGDQSFNSVKTAVFSISNDNSNRVRTMYNAIEFGFAISSPIKYKASCGYLRKTSGGEISLIPYENSSSYLPMDGYTTMIRWLAGQPGEECSVFTYISFDGKSEQVSYDLYPEPIYQ